MSQNKATCLAPRSSTAFVAVSGITSYCAALLIGQIIAGRLPPSNARTSPLLLPVPPLFLPGRVRVPAYDGINDTNFAASSFPLTPVKLFLKSFIRMASSSTPKPLIPAEDLESFRAHLNKSTRILALLGAGLSASSGLPTFRGAGGYWRTHDATELATPEAFDRDPGLVWQFYSYRRHMALKAKPNPAHYALAELAKKKEGFLTLSQNVDGMSRRALQHHEK